MRSLALAQHATWGLHCTIATPQHDRPTVPQHVDQNACPRPHADTTWTLVVHNAELFGGASATLSGKFSGSNPNAWVVSVLSAVLCMDTCTPVL